MFGVRSLRLVGAVVCVGVVGLGLVPIADGAGAVGPRVSGRVAEPSGEGGLELVRADSQALLGNYGEKVAVSPSGLWQALVVQDGGGFRVLRAQSAGGWVDIGGPVGASLYRVAVDDAGGVFVEGGSSGSLPKLFRYVGAGWEGPFSYPSGWDPESESVAL